MLEIIILMGLCYQEKYLSADDTDHYPKDKYEIVDADYP